MTLRGGNPLDLRALINARLDQPVEPAVAALCARLSARAGVAAILFYGNRLRRPDPDSLIDLYVLTDSDLSYHGVGISALANTLLPPNVYFEHGDGIHQNAAKVAVMRLAAFHRRMHRASWDTTLWARFCQPVAICYARDADARRAVVDALAQALNTAAWWAARFARENADATEAWAELFARTYGAELRVEGKQRGNTIIAQNPRFYAAVHQHLIAGAQVTPQERARAAKAWLWRRRAGKLLNAARLAKAAFTFRGGFSYAVSKIERHSGAPVVLSPWERRVPWLAAPIVFLRLLRQKRLH